MESAKALCGEYLQAKSCENMAHNLYQVVCLSSEAGITKIIREGTIREGVELREVRENPRRCNTRWRSFLKDYISQLHETGTISLWKLIRWWPFRRYKNRKSSCVNGER